MSRARRILDALIDAGKPLNLSDIIRVIDDGTVPLDKLGHRISAQLAIFVGARKVKRTGILGHYHFAPTKTALVDLRIKPPTTKSTARKRRKADKVTVPRAPALPAPPPKKVVLVNPPALRPTTPRVTARDQIAADVEAFLAKGGRIQQLSPGQCANPTQAWLEANGLAKPRKPRKQPTTATRDEDELDDVAV